MSTTKSDSVVQALDRIGDAIATAGGAVNIQYPGIRNGPVELVLAFNNDETIALKDHKTDNPYFSSGGQLTDLRGSTLPGSEVRTTFPVIKGNLGETVKWPTVQVEPYNKPPLDDAYTTGHGPSKQAYFFDGGSNYLVTVGPSLPKILKLKDGGAQFWVASIGVIAQGGGKYEGAKGMSVYIGSAYLPNWPDPQTEQLELLAKGFHAKVGTYFKIVLKHDQA